MGFHALIVRDVASFGALQTPADFGNITVVLINLVPHVFALQLQSSVVRRNFFDQNISVHHV